MAWHEVANADEVREDEPLAVKVGETLIALIRLDDQVYGTSNVCTHQFALMSDGFVDRCVEHYANTWPVMRWVIAEVAN